MKNNEPKFEILRMPPENTNSVLVSVGGDAVIFDAWGRASDWVRVLNERGLTLRTIYSTHGHTDHISAAPELAEKYNVPWFLNAADNDLIMWGNMLLDYFEMPRIQPGFRPSTDIKPGHVDVLPGVHMHVYAAPGHSAGGMMYHFPAFQILLTGDTIFHDGVGRTDFPGGDANKLRQTITGLYNLNLPDETYLVHGHGTDSTIETLKQTNPWFKQAI